MAFPLPGANWTYLHALTRKASTGISGFALADGTGTIISWTAPNDGQLHRFTLLALAHVSSAETGGQVVVEYAGPWTGAVTHTTTLFAAGLASDGGAGTAPSSTPQVTVGPGTTVTIAQATALTAGAATVYAEIWGS